MKKYITVVIILLGVHMMAYAQPLDRIFTFAAENNPGLQAKYKSFEAAMQRVIQVNSLPDPNLSVGPFLSSVETRVGPQLMKISLSQMFPWFGTLSAKKDAETLWAEAKYQEFLDARNKLYFEVSASYFPLYELHEHIAIERENHRILTSYKDIATALFQNGKGSMVDVLRVDIMLKDATTNLSVLNQQKRPLETQFNTLLNRDEKSAIVIQDTLVLFSITNDYRRDSMLTANPLLAELDLKAKASAAQKQVAIKQGLPKLGVGLDYVIVGKRPDASVDHNGKDVLMPMLTISLPIFRGKYDAAQKEAQLVQESYNLQKAELTNQLISSYEMVWFEIQKQSQLVKLYEEQILESEQSLNLLFKAYSNSGEEFEEVLLMQKQILKYKKLKVSALAAYHTALAKLDYITAKSK